MIEVFREGMICTLKQKGRSFKAIEKKSSGYIFDKLRKIGGMRYEDP